jgi:AcrR family transcriptional regulator
VQAFEQLIRDGFSHDAAYEEISELTVKAIVGGVRQIIYGRLRQGRAIELPALVPDLLTWAASYRHPVPLQSARGKTRKPASPTSESEEPPQKLSRGRHNFPRSFIIHNQRERILDAVADISASKGYAELTVPEIARTAGVSHKTFYEHFTTKDQAFAAAFELAAEQALNATAVAFAAEPQWPSAVHAGIAALVGYMASEPSLARLALVEVLAAGPSLLARRDQTLQGFSIMLTSGQGYPGRSRQTPAIVPEAISGGILEILYYEASHSRITEMTRLSDELTRIALTPFIGSKEAAKTASEAL